MSDNVEIIDFFKDYLKNTKKASQNTYSSYVRDVQQFYDYLVSCISTGFVEVDRSCVCDYITWMQEHGKASSSVLRSVASLKCFYNFLLEQKLVSENPVHDIVVTKTEKKLPQILTSAEVELLLEQPKCTDAKGYRDHAMLELLYATGVRVSELISLNLEDVYLNSGMIRCASNGKERLIPMYPVAVKALSDYVRFARCQFGGATSEKALFLNRSGERISRQGFWKVVKHYQEMAGIAKDITPHTLRHSFAAHLLENGADIHAIQEMMGHANLASTQIYTMVVQSQLKEVYNRTHPRA